MPSIHWEYSFDSSSRSDSSSFCASSSELASVSDEESMLMEGKMC